MIISQTPYRISFAGGGTDLASFYSQEEEGGAVVSTTIAKYIYVALSRSFDIYTRVSLDNETFLVDASAGNYSAIKNDIVRVCLTMYAAKFGHTAFTIHITGDIPGGTGLGSSSALTVGLLKALFQFAGQPPSTPEQLAQFACAVEIDWLGKPIGKQDQYAAACGGLVIRSFLPQGHVRTEKLYRGMPDLESYLMLIYTGKSRCANEILAEQAKNADANRDALRRLRDLAYKTADCIERGDSIRDFGDLLHAGWQCKRGLAAGVTSLQVDNMYEIALENGAFGGRLLGAGSHGFLLVVVQPSQHENIRRSIAAKTGTETKMLPVQFTHHGSQIILDNEERL